MPEALTFKFDARKLLSALEKAPLAVSRELRVEMSQGMRTTAIDARTHHRFKSGHGKKGHLEKAIKYEASPSGLEGRVYIDTGIAPHGASVHDGSKAHIIAPRNKKSLHFVIGGKSYFGGKGGTKYVKHPGTKPDLFVYQAMDRQKPYLLARMEGAVKRAFQIVGFK